VTKTPINVTRDGIAVTRYRLGRLVKPNPSDEPSFTYSALSSIR
jgi:hypothetical protein